MDCIFEWRSIMSIYSFMITEQLFCPEIIRKGPFTHAIFDVISDAISRAKRALPYPTRMLFSRSIVWIGKKVITYCLKTPFISISVNLVVFCRSVTRLKARAGLAGAGFVRKIASKSHRNRMKNRMCKRALRIPSALLKWPTENINRGSGL